MQILIFSVLVLSQAPTSFNRINFQKPRENAVFLYILMSIPQFNEKAQSEIRSAPVCILLAKADTRSAFALLSQFDSRSPPPKGWMGD